MSSGTPAPWSPEWTVDRPWIQRALGAEWGDAFEFYGRLVGHVVQEATPFGEFDEALAATLRESIRAQLPRTIEEIVPFATRQVWNRGLQDSAKANDRRALLARMREISILAGADWSLEDLEGAVDALLR